ncbi:MAG: phosphatase PAP2 family protein [Pseudobutyrivibrio sp.]|nr:phosphatase PAP2 family protein [Pseudobutyrivibrio sp.]
MEAIIESSREFFFPWELDLLHWFQSIHNEFLDFIVPKITFLGDKGWFWIVLTLIFLAVPKSRKLGIQSAIALVITVFVCNIVLKNVVMRCRPCWLEPDVQLLVGIPDDYSFPSGHTNASFAVATAIFTRNKKWGIPALILAALIGISRLYVFVHWPTDVLVGLLIGVTGGIVSYFIVNYIYKKFNKDGLDDVVA